MTVVLRCPDVQVRSDGPSTSSPPHSPPLARTVRSVRVSGPGRMFRSGPVGGGVVEGRRGCGLDHGRERQYRGPSENGLCTCNRKYLEWWKVGNDDDRPLPVKGHHGL